VSIVCPYIRGKKRGKIISKKEIKKCVVMKMISKKILKK